MTAQERFQRAVEEMTVAPRTLTALYVRALVEKHGGKHQAAKAVGAHRRTFQRIVAKRVA